MNNTSCLRVTIAGMVITGVWLPNSLEKSHLKVFYHTYTILFQLLLFFGIIFIEISHLVQVIDDIEETAEVSLLLLTHLAQAAKNVTIWWRQARIKRLLVLLDSPTFNREEPEKKIILEKTVKLAFIMSQTLAVASVFTGLMWGVYPILKPTLMLPLSYPFLDSSSVMFVILYVYQLFSIAINALGDTAEDFLVGGLMLLISTQLDLLCFELTQIGNTVHDKDDDIDRNYEQAVNCVKYHQHIISFIEELGNIFSLPVFCQFAATCIIMCLTAFKITISNEPTEIMTMIFYLVCILAELLVYCYFGNNIMYKSQIVAESAYCSGWVTTSLNTQRALSLVIRRAQVPLIITSGKMFNLSLGTFTMSQIVAESAYCSGWVTTSLNTQRALSLVIRRAQVPLIITSGKMFNLSLGTFTMSQIVAESAYCSGWVTTSLNTQRALSLVIRRAQVPLIITSGKMFNLSLGTFTMSQIVAESAYCSGWVTTSLNTQRALSLVIRRAQVPLIITSGKMFNLSLGTFTMILKSSYSYFAVLNSSKAN